MSRFLDQARFNKAPRISEGTGEVSRTCRRLSRPALVVLIAACAATLFQTVPLHAQNSKSKLPLIGKLTSSNHQQAFTGKIQSLDLKQKVLNVNSLRGRQSEIFPVKKDVRVQAVNGQKMKVTELTPGMTVLIYFNQKSGERRIKNIIVLSSGKSQGKAKRAHSS